jgi:hypothetical protein
MLIVNVGNDLPNYTAPYPRRQFRMESNIAEFYSDVHFVGYGEIINGPDKLTTQFESA